MCDWSDLLRQSRLHTLKAVMLDFLGIGTQNSYVILDLMALRIVMLVFIGSYVTLHFIGTQNSYVRLNGTQNSNVRLNGIQNNLSMLGLTLKHSKQFY